MSDYTDTVDRYLKGLEHVSTGPCPGCGECLECDDPEDPSDEWHDLAGEPHFSWHPCECCGSGLGGDRHPAHGVDHDGEIVHLSICTDCLLYLANGEEPNYEQ